MQNQHNLLFQLLNWQCFGDYFSTGPHHHNFRIQLIADRVQVLGGLHVRYGARSAVLGRAEEKLRPIERLVDLVGDRNLSAERGEWLENAS